MAFDSGLYRNLGRARPGLAGAILFGLAFAVIAIALRVAIGPDVGREQIIFSYPALIVATLLFGPLAGSVTAIVCLLVAWYLVIPYQGSFALRDAGAAITLVVYIIVSGSLVAAIATMRAAIIRYRDLAAGLDATVETRTAERNRIWQRSLESVVIIEADGCVRSANPAFQRLTGLAASDVPRTAFTDLIVEDDRADVHRALAALGLGTGNSATFDARVAGAEGVAWIAWNAVRDEGSIYLVGRDTTVERACNEQLRHTQRMDVIGQMTGGLAHDFANLLNPIALSLGLLRHRHGDDKVTVALLDQADEGNTRAGLLVRRLLAFSRREQDEPAEADAVDLLHQAVPLLRQSVGPRLLLVDIPATLGRVRVSENELEVALLNLALNARDASPPESAIALTARGADGTVTIALRDTGSGMDEETRARAAEPFFTTKPAGEGTGLGLAMVKDFAARSGGTLAIESDPGAGTAVILTLPTI